MVRSGVGLSAAFAALMASSSSGAADQIILPPLCDPFLVFFAANSFALNEEAKSVIRAAASIPAERLSDEVYIGGHTDGTEAPDLALQRAETVRDALIAGGLQASTMRVEGLGATQPLVATPDGLEEPQNRRVVFDVHCS